MHARQENEITDQKKCTHRLASKLNPPGAMPPYDLKRKRKGLNDQLM